jgi:hypothetical protein
VEKGNRVGLVAILLPHAEPTWPTSLKASDPKAPLAYCLDKKESCYSCCSAAIRASQCRRWDCTQRVGSRGKERVRTAIRGYYRLVKGRCLAGLTSAILENGKPRCNSCRWGGVLVKGSLTRRSSAGMGALVSMISLRLRSNPLKPGGRQK